MNARMNARPWLGWTQYDFATLLLRRGEPGDREKAISLLKEALSSAGQLGMTLLTSRGIELRDKST